jgi:sterol 14-demethylase
MEMDLLHNCMKETLRMHPPLVLLMRKVKKPVQYKEYTIPAGDM